MAANTAIRTRVTVCVDLDDDLEVVRAIHRRFVPSHGHLVLSVGPRAGTAEDLMRTMLVHLNVLWRLPRLLRETRTPFDAEQRAIAECEISWALTRTGINHLWVLDADNANLFAWHWLRDTAEREGLRLTLHTTTVPDATQAAALIGYRVRTLSPERLRGPARSYQQARLTP